MESIYTELALYGSKNECARTDNVFFSISEICDGTVSLGVPVKNAFLRYWEKDIISPRTQMFAPING